jgi:hypothetical protein
MPNQKTPRHERKVTEALATIAKAIRDDSREADPTAARELKQSKIANGIQGATLVIAVIGSLFAYGAYVETKRQANEASRQADTAQEQLTDARRPVVLVTSGKPNQDGQRTIVTVPEQDAAGYIVWNVHGFNYGPLPALNVMAFSNVIHGANIDAQIEAYFSGLIARSKQPIGMGSSSIIAPDKDRSDYWFSAASGDAVSKETFARETSLDFMVAVVGRLTYADIVGNVYHTDFCFRLLASTGVALCGAHNELRTVARPTADAR